MPNSPLSFFFLPNTGSHRSVLHQYPDLQDYCRHFACEEWNDPVDRPFVKSRANADGASERRLINKITTMIGTEPEEADVTHVSVYDCGVIPPNCLYFMVLDLCVIDKTLLLCPSSWSGIHLSDVQFAEHAPLTWKILFGRNVQK